MSVDCNLAWPQHCLSICHPAHIPNKTHILNQKCSVSGQEDTLVNACPALIPTRWVKLRKKNKNKLCKMRLMLLQHRLKCKAVWPMQDMVRCDACERGGAAEVRSQAFKTSSFHLSQGHFDQMYPAQPKCQFDHHPSAAGPPSRASNARHSDV